MTVATLTQLADYLVNGYWAWQGTSPHHFASGATITYNLDGLSQEVEKRDAFLALQAWQDVCNVSFVQTSGPALINFTNVDAGASTSPPPAPYTVNISDSWAYLYGSGNSEN